MIRMSVHYASFGPMIRCFHGQLRTQPVEREARKERKEKYFSVTCLQMQDNWSLCENNCTSSSSSSLLTCYSWLSSYRWRAVKRKKVKEHEMRRSWHKRKKTSHSILCHAETSERERGDIFHQLQTLEEETHTVTHGEAPRGEREGKKSLLTSLSITARREKQWIVLGELWVKCLCLW